MHDPSKNPNEHSPKLIADIVIINPVKIPRENNPHIHKVNYVC